MFPALLTTLRALSNQLERELAPQVDDVRMPQAIEFLLGNTLEMLRQHLRANNERDVRLSTSFHGHEIFVEAHLGGQRHAVSLSEVVRAMLLTPEGTVQDEFLFYLDHASFTYGQARTCLGQTSGWQATLSSSAQHLLDVCCLVADTQLESHVAYELVLQRSASQNQRPYTYRCASTHPGETSVTRTITPGPRALA